MAVLVQEREKEEIFGTEKSGTQPEQLNPALRKLQPQKGKVKMGFTAEMQTQYDDGETICSP